MTSLGPHVADAVISQARALLVTNYTWMLDEAMLDEAMLDEARRRVFPELLPGATAPHGGTQRKCRIDNLSPSLSGGKGTEGAPLAGAYLARRS